MTEQPQRYFYFTDDPREALETPTYWASLEGKTPEPSMVEPVIENRVIIRPRADYEIFRRSPMSYALDYLRSETP